MLIDVENVYKSFKVANKKIDVISNFSYKFESGKLYSLKGESGKGKTTLLSMISLLQDIDEGRISYDGKVVSNFKPEEKSKIRAKKIGIIFQDYNLLNGLTVIDNIIIPNVLAKSVSKNRVVEKTERILDDLGLGDKKDVSPLLLSGGEKQRVGIARMLLREPDICICDEPVSNLDDNNSALVVEYLDSYAHEKGKIVITTNHNTNFDEVADYTIRV